MPGLVKPPQRGKVLPSLTPTGESEALGTVMPDLAITEVRDEYVRVGNPAQRFLLSWGDFEKGVARFAEEPPRQRHGHADLTQMRRASHSVLADVPHVLFEDDEIKYYIGEFLETPRDGQYLDAFNYCKAISRVLSINVDQSASLAIGLLWHELANRMDRFAQFDYEAEAAEQRTRYFSGSGGIFDSAKELKNKDQARALKTAHVAYESAEFLFDEEGVKEIFGYGQSRGHNLQLTPTGVSLIREAAKRLTAHGAFRSAALALALTVKSESKFGVLYQGALPTLEDDLAHLTGKKSDWLNKLTKTLESFDLHPIQETPQPLSKLIPIHNLYHGKNYLATLQSIRQVMFIELLLRGWRLGELPNPDTLEAIMYDNGNLAYQQLLPKISRPDSRGHCLVLNGHHRIAALITLVADGFLPVATLKDIPVDRTEVDSEDLLNRALGSDELPEHSWATVMRFHRASYQLTRRMGVPALREKSTRASPHHRTRREGGGGSRRSTFLTITSLGGKLVEGADMMETAMLEI